MRPPFRRLWTFHGRHLLEFPPVVGYGSVFEEVFDGRLYSLDPASGRVRWRYDSHLCGWSSPALADRLLFATFIGNSECHAPSGGGELVAFSPETGRVRWRREIGPSESSPLVAGGTVYVGSQDGHVYAFASRTGRLRWSFDTGAPIKASASLAYGRIFIGNYAGELYALDARTGGLDWRSGGYGNFYSTAAVTAGRVYVGSVDGHVYAFSARNGDLLWSFGTGSYVYASPAVWHGLVLVGSYDHDFYAVSAGTGALRWSFRAGAPISGAASVVDGFVYFSSFEHRTYALAASTGRLREQWNDGEYSPAVAGERPALPRRPRPALRARSAVKRLPADADEVRVSLRARIGITLGCVAVFLGSWALVHHGWYQVGRGMDIPIYHAYALDTSTGRCPTARSRSSTRPASCCRRSRPTDGVGEQRQRLHPRLRSLDGRSGRRAHPVLGGRARRRCARDGRSSRSRWVSSRSRRSCSGCSCSRASTSGPRRSPSAG